MFCIIINQTEANVWLKSGAHNQHLRRLIMVTYASSQWRGKKCLIEHVFNVKTLNGSEHHGRSFFSFFLLKLKILEVKVKFWCGTHMTQFFWKNSWFLQNFTRERTVFHFIFIENGKSEAVFQHFWSARRQFVFKNVHSGKTGASESKELKLKLVWPKHTNILFIFSFLFFRYSNMITCLLQNW